MEKTYFITTYGCQLNVHESEKLAGILHEIGYKESESLENASMIIFNTCAIRENAENRALGNIGALKKLKSQNRNKILIVTGCMTQQKNEAEALFKTFPFIDIIIGTSNLHKIREYIETYQTTHKRMLKIEDDFCLTCEKVPFYRTSGENAWVNIMQGCNNFCSYCIVPFVRGRERSRSKEEIIEEIKEILKDKSYKKITLLGQNVNSYGKDNGQCSFAQLLNEISDLEGDFSLTFMTSHPKDLTSDVIDVIAKKDKILKAIHLPIQSGSDKILSLMNRKYDRKKYLSIIEEIRRKIPNCDITTDIIVGFPGENEEDFNATCDILKKVKYNSIFAFMYSKRKGTIAEKMENQVPEEIKNQRVNYILNLQKKISEE